jgi:hypothetical protein
MYGHVHNVDMYVCMCVCVCVGLLMHSMRYATPRQHSHSANGVQGTRWDLVGFFSHLGDDVYGGAWPLWCCSRV